MNNEDLLKQFKLKINDIQALVSKRHKLEGQKEQLMSDLLKKFDLNDKNEALKKLEKLNSDLVFKEEDIKSRLNILDEVVQQAKNE